MEGPNALGSRYELEQKLGVGAMGEVWRALDRRSGQRVAAKVLRAEFARDTDIVTRFIQERSILMGLTHPNIVRVRDLVVEGERLAIVMDLIEGGDLRHHLREHGPIAADHAVPLACVVLDALDSAHQSGCLHRDVKPDNVLLVDGDVARPQNLRLSDFSIARLAHDSTVQSTGLLGTPNYMPPELFRVGQFSAASDVYATGILLYEMLGGRTPFAGSGTAHTMGNRHVSSLPPRLPVSEPLWAAIEQMLAKDPRDRLRAAATASLLRGLPSDALGADALPLQPVPEVWEDVAQTVVRRPASAGPSGLGSEATEARRASAAQPTWPQGAPGTDPGTGSGAPTTEGGSDRRSQGPPPEHPPRPPARRRAAAPTRSRWVPWAAAAAAVVLLGVGGITWATARGGDSPREEPTAEPAPPGGGPAATAQRTDTTLPLGLTVSRSATYDPTSGAIDLTIAYSASTAPLTGPFLEVFPPAADGSGCPLAAWDGRQQQRTSTTSSGVRTECAAYVVEVPALPAQGREEVSVVVSGVGLDTAQDPGALQDWLEDVSAATTLALAGESVRDDQFPAQRVTGVWLEASPFSVRLREEIRVEVGPQFVTGERGPAFFDSFTTSGAPSGFLRQIAGGYDGVRLSACPAVKVTAQNQVSGLVGGGRSCSIEVEVGKLLVAEDSVRVTGAGS